MEATFTLSSHAWAWLQELQSNLAVLQQLGLGPCVSCPFLGAHALAFPCQGYICFPSSRTALNIRL